MSETLIGCIVAGAVVLIALPAILKHYIRERERDRVLQNLREQMAASKGVTK
ncbi:hypothetical protein [Caballeronia sp. Sq4a]|uniref:hypothetical protein n=1 Tax=Caballeronia sp. Sq4a TaxID=2878152 RepID=UPI0020C0C2B7|nr:hypothetical protein [Caballeronia sp. Sq4a]